MSVLNPIATDRPTKPKFDVQKAADGKTKGRAKVIQAAPMHLALFLVTG